MFPGDFHRWFRSQAGVTTRCTVAAGCPVSEVNVFHRGRANVSVSGFAKTRQGGACRSPM